MDAQGGPTEQRGEDSGPRGRVSAEGPGERSRWVCICNQRGLHARAAAKFVRLAGSFDSEIFVSRNDLTVSGQSIMGLMMLSAQPGCDVHISASGPDADAALTALAALIDSKFDED